MMFAVTRRTLVFTWLLVHVFNFGLIYAFRPLILGILVSPAKESAEISIFLIKEEVQNGRF